jgi:drug/metabolite transporter (DMT)-like permease
VGQFLGALGMIAAAAFYALAGFIVKRRYGHLAAVQTSWVSVTVGAALSLPVAVATAPGHTPTLRAVVAVVVLGVVGTALAFVIFYELIGTVGAGRAALVSYLAPGVALLYGAALLDEPITVAALLGLMLILGGVALGSGAWRPARRRRQAALADQVP